MSLNCTEMSYINNINEKSRVWLFLLHPSRTALLKYTAVLDSLAAFLSPVVQEAEVRALGECNGKLLPPANEVWGKVIFLHLSVILFTGGQGVPRQVPPRQVHPGQVHHPALHAGIRSTSGRYAFYWNAFLLSINLKIIPSKKVKRNSITSNPKV